MSNIQLLALDLDGTLFNNSGMITPRTIEAIEKAIQKGVHVIISTGRPYCGIPFEQLKAVDIQYAITTNGAAVYDIQGITHYANDGSPKKLLFEQCLTDEQTKEILPFLLAHDIHMDAFIHGDGFSPSDRLGIAQELSIPESLKKYIIGSRKRVDDFEAFIIENHIPIQKMTLNFIKEEDGSFRDREEIRLFLENRPDVVAVCGGYNNLEFTGQGVTKGEALRRLAKQLNIPMECTMAIGDTENDISILEAAHLGIAMGNAPEDIKKIANAVTSSNEEDGVAFAIEKYIL